VVILTDVVGVYKGRLLAVILMVVSVALPSLLVDRVVTIVSRQRATAPLLRGSPT
jgi:hypothetical protein